ncbi:hypothetical protein, partial [Escherichia coli]
ISKLAASPPSVYGDAAEWNTAELRREMSHS